jgi:hypothetical protein
MHRTKADACSSLVSSFYTDLPPKDGIDAHRKTNGTRTFRWLPVGSAAGVGAFTNRFGDANFFVRADVFDALGGFTRDRLSFEDWQFLSKLVLAGYNLEVVAEPLFWKRELQESMMHAMDGRDKLRGTIRALTPYLHLEAAAGAPLFAGMLAFQDRNGGQRRVRSDSVEQFSVVQVSWVGFEHKMELNLKMNE